MCVVQLYQRYDKTVITKNEVQPFGRSEKTALLLLLWTGILDYFIILSRDNKSWGKFFYKDLSIQGFSVNRLFRFGTGKSKFLCQPIIQIWTCQVKISLSTDYSDLELSSEDFFVNRLFRLHKVDSDHTSPAGREFMSLQDKERNPTWALPWETRRLGHAWRSSFWCRWTPVHQSHHPHQIRWSTPGWF